MDKKKALALINKRTNLVNKLSSALENRVKDSELELFREVLDEFVDKLDRKDGKIENNSRNRQLLQTLDKVFSDFALSNGVAIASSIVKGVSEIFNFNNQYYSAFESEAKLVPISKEVKSTLEGWLGMDSKGNLTENGYLSNLIQDTTVRNQIKDLVVKSIVSGNGLTETRQQLKQTIVGDKENLGAMQKHYRNFVYDTFSQVDRTAAKITADKLQLNYAIYEGGLIETSRPFCKKHNGNVYSRAEIAEFDPKTAKQPNYNPFTDLGGYGCRHHLNWIPDLLAQALGRTI